MQPDKLRRLIELRSFPAVVSQIQREKYDRLEQPPTEEEIATAIIDHVPLIDVKAATFSRVMVDLYETRGREVTKDIDGRSSIWWMEGKIIARSDNESLYQIRPSFMDPDLNRFDTLGR